MYKTLKIRIYPNEQQEELLWKHIHACRFVWNYMLGYQIDNYKNGGKHLSCYDMTRLLTPLKQQEDYKWLYDVSNASLQRTCRDLEFAFVDFFNNKKGYPKFKTKKRGNYSYPVRDNRFHFNNDNTVTVEKIGKIKIKERDNIKYDACKIRIKHINKKWILSFSVECENQAKTLNDYHMGIDLGVKELAVVAYGNNKIVFHNINNSKRVKTLEHKLLHIQRVISRKYRTNKNYDKTHSIMKYDAIRREIYYKLSNIRKNYIHQTTRQLVNLLPSCVVMEDLDVSDMMKNKHLHKRIADQCLFTFIQQMKYKCMYEGIPFIQVDKYYPSSKTCSCCGNVKKDLRLSDRIYCCNKCGLLIDRDYNAAINLMKHVSHQERLTA